MKKDLIYLVIGVIVLFYLFRKNKTDTISRPVSTSKVVSKATDRKETIV